MGAHQMYNIILGVEKLMDNNNKNILILIHKSKMCMSSQKISNTLRPRDFPRAEAIFHHFFHNTVTALQ